MESNYFFRNWKSLVFSQPPLFIIVISGMVRSFTDVGAWLSPMGKEE
ncbi:hypothetical protein GKC33_04385 [Lactobacillus salivarius]|uniref:Uncharacterized protein n=1 Tax=Ligilactobacillus salivarius TaxID=1624 RepID=A0A6A8LSG1_9LACO|nr:hypothetical protein [Ligilactobacillus salivarius]MSE07981.1 hypothetical protein [Ligilactobacillus salivarius]